jgi:hypothetical protein
MSPISTSGSPAASIAATLGQASSRICFNASLEVFPQVSHTTCGGGPWRSSNWTKSLSFVMTTAFAEQAASKIAASEAFRNPRSRTGTASTSKASRTQVARSGDNCASIQIVTERHQAAMKGWPRRRLARRRQAVMSSDSRSGSSARTCSRDRPFARYIPAGLPRPRSRRIAEYRKTHVLARAIIASSGKGAPRHRRHLRHQRHCGICNLQNPKEAQRSESHSLRHPPPLALNLTRATAGSAPSEGAEALAKAAHSLRHPSLMTHAKGPPRSAQRNGGPCSPRASGDTPAFAH